MGLIYGVFAIVLSVMIIINLMQDVHKEEKWYRSVSVTLAFIGLNYLAVFIQMGISNDLHMMSLIIFQSMLMSGMIWHIHLLDFKKIRIPSSLILGVVIFSGAWSYVALASGMATTIVILPATLMAILASFVLAFYYFLRPKTEVPLKSILGAMYIMMGFVKVMYIVNAEHKEVIYFIGIFVLDYLIYVLVAMMIYLTEFFKNR